MARKASWAAVGDISSSNDWGSSSRTCEVYIGAAGTHRSLPRFVDWFRTELELNGIQCFVFDQNQGRDSCAYRIAREAMRSAILGVILITWETFSSPCAMEEIKWFSEKCSLVPIFFGFRMEDCLVRDIVEKKGKLWQEYGGSEEEWTRSVNRLCSMDCKLETCGSSYRDCVLDGVVMVGRRLGRRDIAEKVMRWKEFAAKTEHPFPRSHDFVGRLEELRQLELMLFGYTEDDSKVSRGMKKIMEVDESCKEIMEAEGFRGKHQMGIACVCGESGIGKTELLLEFAYRFSQRYKMVLWVGGEAKYFRMNYLNLSSTLGVDLSSENEAFLKGNATSIDFKEAEGKAIKRVRKELMRDIPFLLVIDNLEAENDWWDGRNLMEILPPLGGQTHFLISTKMSTVMNLKSLKISSLSHSDAIVLLKGHSVDLSPEDMDALDLAEVKLGKLPLGLAIFGALLSEFPVTPRKLLSIIEGVPEEHFILNEGEQSVFEKYPAIFQLLGVCCLAIDLAENCRNFASRMVLACGWFAPSLIPINLLFTAALDIREENQCAQLLKKFQHSVKCMHKKPDAEAASALVRVKMAKSCCTREGCIYFHEIIKEYARKKANLRSANAMVSAIFRKSPQKLDPEHIWAAGFALFRLGTSLPVVRLKASELVAFITKHILPLALSVFASSCRCQAASELLLASEESLKKLESSFSQEKKSFRVLRKNRLKFQSGRGICKDIYLLRATILETRAEMLLRGGYYEIAERLCRSALNIKEVFYASGHPETVAIQETISKILRLQEG